MHKSKFVALVAAATIALTLGLVACGGQQQAEASKAEEAAATDTAATEAKGTDAATAEGADDTPIATVEDPTQGLFEWGAEGMTDDGAYGVFYVEARSSQDNAIGATLVLKDLKTGTSVSWIGQVTERDGTCTLIDIQTDSAITYTKPEVDAGTGQVKINIGEQGAATLAMAEDVKEVNRDIAKALTDSDAKAQELVPETK